MPPFRDEGAVPPPFDPDAQVTNPETTQTITEVAFGPVSFLDDLDVSTFDVSGFDFPEIPNAHWPIEHASTGDIVPAADNSPWPAGIHAGEISQSVPNVEGGPSQDLSLWLAFPSPGEGDLAAFEPSEFEPMDLDPASNIPFPPNESTLGEAQPGFDQHEVLGDFESLFDQTLGLQLSGDVEMPDARTELHEPQHSLDVLEPGPSAFISGWPPMLPQQRPLVPRKRGGRHGQLNEDQLKRQRLARSTGVCIRCKYLNKSCHGGFPCEACQDLRKPRLFKGPCTKAQFLEIIQAGSFFLRTSLYEAMALEHLDEHTAWKLRLGFLISESLGRPLVIEVLGQECRVPYLLGSDMLKLLFFLNPEGRFQKPDNSKVARLLGALAKHAPGSDYIEFPYGFKGSQRVHWTLFASSFCSGKRLFLPKSGEAGDEENLAPPCLDGSPSDTFGEDQRALIWLSCRYAELCLFLHLQETANLLAQKSTPDVNLVYCIFIILRMSMANDKLENSLKRCEDPHREDVVKEYVDRRRRVRMALWVYASIVISKIPSWTNFWENLPWSVDIFRDPHFLGRCADSLDAFDVEACKASKSVFSSTKTVFQRLSFSDQLPPPENDPEDQDDIEKLWARVLTNTPEGIEQLTHVLSDTSGGSTDGVTQYEQDEAERVFLPKTEQDQKVAINTVFDILISLRKIPIDRDEVFEHESFQWLVSVIEQFQLRLGLEDQGNSASTSQSPGGSATAQHHAHPPIPSRAELREYIRTPKCIRASKRWKELAHILGDGILLTGYSGQDPHSFLDIATVVECGHDAAFSRLKWLLQLKGSWLKAICAKLGGLVQALRELPYPAQDLESSRDFCKQVHNATSDTFGEAVMPDADDSSHKDFVSNYLFLTRHACMPSRSEVSERHRTTWDILADVIDQTRTELLEDELTLDDDVINPLAGLAGALEVVVERFMARYVDTLGEDTTNREDAAVDMAGRVSSAMGSGLIFCLKDNGCSMDEFPLPDLPEDLSSTHLFELVFAD